MMGSQTGSQDRLFYSFNLDEHIPQNHLLRSMDRCLDLSELRQHLADYYSHTGRPSTDSRTNDPHADHWLLLRHSF